MFAFWRFHDVSYFAIDSLNLKRVRMGELTFFLLPAG